MIVTLDPHRLRKAIAAVGANQTSIARLSGVSRAQLSRLLAGNEARVRQSTLTQLARALRVGPDALAVGGPIACYREWLAEEAGYVDFRGFGMPSVQRQPIQEVFVDLAVEEDIGECQKDCSPGESRSRSLRRPSDRTTTATRCVLDHDRVIVLGSPGGGKTTLLRFLAYSSATTAAEQAETPIYVRLPELCRGQKLDEDFDLVNFLAVRSGERGCPDMEVLLRQELADESRRCLVLLDGLDEVCNQEQREWLIRGVQAFVEQYPRNRYAITSRPVGFDAAPWRSQGFSVFRILEYDKTRLECFADKWAAVLSRADNKPYSEVRGRLNHAIFDSPRVRALACNPLILTILVLLNEARGGILPRRRVDLYEKVVDVFLDTWESTKQSVDKFDDTRGIDLDAREFRWLLSDLSLAMQKAERTLAPRWWIAEKIEDYLQHKLGFLLDEAKDACDRVIRYLAQRTALIEERGLGLFGFSHRTLQEYFASRGVIDEADAAPERGVTECLRGYYFHPQWSEVVRLVAAQLTPPMAESLLSSVLDDPDTVGRFLRRGHLLALRCLSDGTSIANRRFISGIFDSLAELGRSRWLGITLEVMEVFADLQGTRLEESANLTLETILETAEHELDAEEYQCLHYWGHGHKAPQCTEERLPESFRTEEAAREITVAVGDKTYPVFHINAKLLAKDPARWHASARRLLEDPNQTLQLKELLVREMGRRVVADRECRMRLRQALCSGEVAPLRAACAEGLAAVTRIRNNIKQLLLRILAQDQDNDVRRACAVALRDIADRDPVVADRLVNILESDQSSVVRSGAATALAKAARLESVIRELLERHLAHDNESDDVRIACACALEPQIADDSALVMTLKSWLQSPGVPRLARTGAQLLAGAMAYEKINWDHKVIEKAENLLMGLENPCSCALESLEAIATAREVRHGLRLENVLRDSLRPLADSIELAFVFGSTARNRQMQDSDIDLFILGDATLKSLSGPLRQAEKLLGRRVNPAIYTRDSFRDRYQRGDPFLLDVCRREKLPVIQKSEEHSQKEFDDELRAMVAEHVASTA
jgi:predicted nucleotidyltransferase/transcriptional regulator with XRE-family HTH domain